MRIRKSMGQLLIHPWSILDSSTNQKQANSVKSRVAPCFYVFFFKLLFLFIIYLIMVLHAPKCKLLNDIIIFLYKSLNSLVDSRMFVEKFVIATNRETRNPRTFAPPIARTNLGLNSPFYRMMSTFDSLSLCNENLFDLNSFKNSIFNLTWV
jgi:hypothetical protein